MEGSRALELSRLFEQSGGESAAPVDLEALFASSQEEAPEPQARWRHRGTRCPLYRLRLNPGERQALLCLLILGMDGDGNPLVRSVCGCGPRTPTPPPGARKQALRRAAASGELRAQRISGTGDYDVLIARRLVGPLRMALEEILERGTPGVFPRFRATKQQLDALYEAVTPRGLTQRAYGGKGGPKRGSSALDLEALFTEQAGEQGPVASPVPEPTRQDRRREPPTESQRSERRTPSVGFPPGPSHILGTVVGYQEFIEQEPHRVSFIDLEDPQEIAQRAVQLRGTRTFKDAVVRFGGGRYWLAPATVSTALVLVDTETPGAEGQRLGPFRRRVQRWYYQAPEGREPARAQRRGPRHNYASRFLWGARAPGVPEHRRAAMVRKAVEQTLAGVPVA